METESEVQKQCREIGLDFIKISDAVKEFPHGGLAVEVDLFGTAETKWLDGMMIEKKTGRKDVIYLWFEKPAMDGVTTLKIAQPFRSFRDADFYMAACERMGSLVFANSFADFCWYHSTGTTAETAQEIVTPLRKDALKDNLTHFLSCRFADNLVEITQTLNQTLFEGIMFDSVLYGPYIVDVDVRKNVFNFNQKGKS